MALSSAHKVEPCLIFPSRTALSALVEHAPMQTILELALWQHTTDVFLPDWQRLMHMCKYRIVHKYKRAMAFSASIFLYAIWSMPITNDMYASAIRAFVDLRRLDVADEVFELKRNLMVSMDQNIHQLLEILWRQIPVLADEILDIIFHTLFLGAKIMKTCCLHWYSL